MPINKQTSSLYDTNTNFDLLNKKKLSSFRSLKEKGAFDQRYWWRTFSQKISNSQDLSLVFKPPDLRFHPFPSHPAKLPTSSIPCSFSFSFHQTFICCFFVLPWFAVYRWIVYLMSLRGKNGWTWIKPEEIGGLIKLKKK